MLKQAGFRRVGRMTWATCGVGGGEGVDVGGGVGVGAVSTGYPWADPATMADIRAAMQ